MRSDRLKPLDLKLTLKDRWMLWSMYKVMALVDRHGRDGHFAMMEALQNGYHWHYGDPFWFFNRDEDCLAKEDAADFGRAVALYRRINHSMKKLAEKPVLKGYFARFRGVDRETEEALYEYQRYVRQDRNDGLLDLLPGSDDSGIPNTLAIYRKMLRTWEELGSPRELTAEQIVRIVGAAPDVTPPDRRGGDGPVDVR
jgi:uncharacterized protein YfbU (UPF0304 family)